MTHPVRLQLRRTKGFRLQDVSLATNGLPAVNVARPSLFGNIKTCARPHGCPYDQGFRQEDWQCGAGINHRHRCCVDVYRHYIETGLANAPSCTGSLAVAMDAINGYPVRTRVIKALPRLRGKNLACWCKPQDRCHADVLLEVVNR